MGHPGYLPSRPSSPDHRRSRTHSTTTPRSQNTRSQPPSGLSAKPVAVQAAVPTQAGVGTSAGSIRAGIRTTQAPSRAASSKIRILRASPSGCPMSPEPRAAG
ncbi:hypothetical protein T261_0164 [Streptomyces lydicus]|nr:hypothetical protein T261_0164 [Streptomyces lydicus]